MRVVIVAWGRDYVWLAKNLAIASLMAAGNVPAVGAEVRVYTDAPDAFPGLDVVKISPAGESKHRLVSECHRKELRVGSPVIIMPPDCVISDGALLACANRAGEGKRLIVVPAVRLERGGALEELKAVDGVLSVTPRALSAIGLRHLHPGTAQMFEYAKPFTDLPYQVYRRIEGGIAATCYHMHPLMINMCQHPVREGTVDGQLMSQFTPDNAYVVTDSDEISMFELSPQSQDWGQHEAPYYVPAIKQWAARKANRMHHWFATHECRIHA